MIPLRKTTIFFVKSGRMSSLERRDLHLTEMPFYYKELRSLLQGLCKDIIGSHLLIVVLMFRNDTSWNSFSTYLFSSLLD